MLDAYLVDARPADAAPDEGGNAFAVPANSAAYAGDPEFPTTAAAANEAGARAVSSLRRRARREAQVRGPRRADVLARVRDAVHRARVADLLGLLPSAAMAERGER